MSILPNLDVDLDLAKFDTQAKELFEQVRSGKAFSNPLTTGLSALEQTVTSVRSDIVDKAVELAALPGNSSSDVDDLLDKVDEFAEKQTEFISHTNRQAGVDLTSGEKPNLHQLMSVSSNHVALNHALDKAIDNPCGSLVTMFGSLILGSDIVDEAAGLYQLVVASIEDSERTIAEAISEIEAIKNKFDSLMVNDYQAFTNAVNDLTYHAVSSMLGDFYLHPCGRHILKETIGTDSLLDLVK